MKKIFIIIPLTIFSFGCSSSQNVSAPPVSEESETSCTLHDTLKIELDVQMGTGFSWFVKSSDGFEIVSKPEIKSIDGHKLETGFKDKMIFEFKAIKSGIQKIIMEYRQPWEKDKPAEKTRIITVNVKS